MKRVAMSIILGLVFLSTSSCGRTSGDRSLAYVGATEQSLAIGDAIPGANIRFVGYSDAGAEIPNLVRGCWLPDWLC